MEPYDQNNDTEAPEQFQNVLDEDTKFTDGIIDKISQLKVLKEKIEKKCRELETRA